MAQCKGQGGVKGLEMLKQRCREQYFKQRHGKRHKEEQVAQLVEAKGVEETPASHHPPNLNAAPLWDSTAHWNDDT